jgi:hypothetical protein
MRSEFPQACFKHISRGSSWFPLVRVPISGGTQSRELVPESTLVLLAAKPKLLHVESTPRAGNEAQLRLKVVRAFTRQQVVGL